MLILLDCNYLKLHGAEISFGVAPLRIYIFSFVCTDAYKGMVSDDEKRRLHSIERFDEVEEWELLMSHYSLLLGVKGAPLVDLVALMP
jgi:hypothetical protein